MTTRKNSISRSSLQHGYVLLALALFGLLPTPKAFGVSPPPDGDVGNGNTAEGTAALSSLSGGSYNTAVGLQSLFSTTTGVYNTATGVNALYSNTDGAYNTANGGFALFSNTTGTQNTATGLNALVNNTTGSFNTATGVGALAFTFGDDNTATGWEALFNNIGDDNTATGFEALFHNLAGGNNNTATGAHALQSNEQGMDNTATGAQALQSNIGNHVPLLMGSENTATGVQALQSNTFGSDNTAEGFQALANSTGSNNIALGANAGSNLTAGDNNIDIYDPGVAGESNTIRIGTQGTQTATFIAGISGAMVAGSPVLIDATTGQLGVAVSSRRFKEQIKPMDKASEAILALKPVTFRYKKNIDPNSIPQFGLVAEQVERVTPDLILRDSSGTAYTVRYEAVNAMLLNEFLKEHKKSEEQGRKVQEQEATITQLKTAVAQQEATAARQQKQIETLTTGLQRVSAQVELSRPAPQIAVSDP